MGSDLNQYKGIINDCYKWLRKYIAIEKRDDDFWHNAIAETEEIVTRNKSDYAHEVVWLCIKEMSNVKDLDKPQAKAEVYYNAFLDCSKLLKMTDEGFDCCFQSMKKMRDKYKDNWFAEKLFDTTIEEVAKLIDVKIEEGG